MGHSRPLFLYFRLFYKQLTVNKCSIKVADDWIRTRALWYWKQPLCQLRHNHCLRRYSFYLGLDSLNLLGIADVLDEVGGVLGEQNEDRDQRQDQHVGRVKLLANGSTLSDKI